MTKLLRYTPKRLQFPGLNAFFWIAAIEGFLLSVPLFALPADAENRIFLNLTHARLVVLLVLLLPTLLVLFLAIKSRKDFLWSQKWWGTIFDNQNVVPYITIAFLVILLFAGSIFVMYYTTDFETLNQSSMVRLSPPLIWAGLILVQLWVIWLWKWKRHAIRIPQWTWDALAAGVLFFVALWPRIQMTSYALPYQSVWDEVVTYAPALKMLSTPGMNPDIDIPGYGHAAYGDLVSYLATGGELLGLLDGLRSGAVTSVRDYISPPQGVNSVVSAVNVSGLPLQVPRMLFAVINSLAPLGIYLALRKGLRVDHWSAFGGGFIYALLSRDVIYYSSYMLPDALTATVIIFLLIAVWKSMEDENNHLWMFLLSGVLAGIMVSLTIRVAIVILAPILGVFFSRNKRPFFVKLLVVIAGIIGGFLLSSPYALLDLPSYLSRVTGLWWRFDYSLANRLHGLVYYIKGAFLPGFYSEYIDTRVGSVGLGLIAGFLAIIGAGKLLLRVPRQAIIMLVIVALHLYVISPTVNRFTRHALMLYPIFCIFAGAGLSWIVEGSQLLYRYLAGKFTPRTNPNRISSGAPAFFLVVLLAVSFPQLNLSLQYVNRTHNYQTPQVQAANYLSTHMKEGDKVGILQDIPWVENDLVVRHIPYVRIPSSDTIADLKAQNITLVAGTDRFRRSFSSLEGTIWQTAFADPGVKLAEFGKLYLEYEGHPIGQLYIFIARVP